MKSRSCWAGPSVAATLGLLEQVKRCSADRKWNTDVYFENRTVEFLLTLRKLEGLEVLPISRFLELGCGIGYSLLLWSQVADQAVGVDLPEVIGRGRELLGALDLPAANISLQGSTAEDVQAGGRYDVILTQYVLEHVRDIGQTLQNLRAHLEQGGVAIHVLNGCVDRLGWYAEYRLRCSLPRRLAQSVRDRGLLRTLANPFNFTPAHEPRFGDYTRELSEYSLERWALRLYMAGFQIVDVFQTRDTNWVFVTRATEQAAG